jgi:hypothetical protein
VTTITLANGKPLPRAGVFAHGEGLTVAWETAAMFAGRPTPPAFDGMGCCWVECGAGRAAFAVGEFFAEPDPVLRLRRPGLSWHLGKILFERSWIGARHERRAAHAGLVAASRLLGLRGTFWRICRPRKPNPTAVRPARLPGGPRQSYARVSAVMCHAPFMAGDAAQWGRSG